MNPDSRLLKCYARLIIIVHRLSTIRIISAFRTLYTDAAAVLAIMPPIDIQGEELERTQLSAPTTVSTKAEKILIQRTVDLQTKMTSDHR